MWLWADGWINEVVLFEQSIGSAAGNRDSGFQRYVAEELGFLGLVGRATVAPEPPPNFEVMLPRVARAVFSVDRNGLEVVVSLG